MACVEAICLYVRHFTWWLTLTRTLPQRSAKQRSLSLFSCVLPFFLLCKKLACAIPVSSLMRACYIKWCLGQHAWIPSSWPNKQSRFGSAVIRQRPSLFLTKMWWTRICLSEFHQDRLPSFPLTFYQAQNSISSHWRTCVRMDNVFPATTPTQSRCDLHLDNVNQ